MEHKRIADKFEAPLLLVIPRRDSDKYDYLAYRGSIPQAVGHTDGSKQRKVIILQIVATIYRSCYQIKIATFSPIFKIFRLSNKLNG